MKKDIQIEIDDGSGFCFGVVNAIRKAEKALLGGIDLHCLGDIVHNNMEIKRLERMGLKTINQEDYKALNEKTVLLRAHGEPPSTYRNAEERNLTIIDATCPVVLRLQRNVNKAYQKSQKDNGQVVIYGKKGHAEVIGLDGQCNGKAIVIENIDDISKVALDRPIRLFSQTTMMVDLFLEIKTYFEDNIASQELLEVNNTICKQVSGRIEALHAFCEKNDLIIFVSGKKSSNGKALFGECIKANKASYMVACPEEVKEDWLENATKIGVCGATSTPKWLMNDVAKQLKKVTT